jgi:hypothetical protein
MDEKTDQSIDLGGATPPVCTPGNRLARDSDNAQMRVDRQFLGLVGSMAGLFTLAGLSATFNPETQSWGAGGVPIILQMTSVGALMGAGLGALAGRIQRQG